MAKPIISSTLRLKALHYAIGGSEKIIKLLISKFDDAE